MIGSQRDEWVTMLGGILVGFEWAYEDNNFILIDGAWSLGSSDQNNHFLWDSDDLAVFTLDIRNKELFSKSTVLEIFVDSNRIFLDFFGKTKRYLS